MQASVPPIIRSKLARLGRRERALALVWGAARWLLVVLAALLVACGLDWYLDRGSETPLPVRGLMLAVQAALWLAAAWLLIRPALRRRSERELALWVEDRLPDLDHRLITTVELNRPDAHRQGMSGEMIAAVTADTAKYASLADFNELPDRRRLRWAAWAVLPAAAAWVAVLLAWPETMKALLARQLLADREIPRAIRLECTAPDLVCPAGEEVLLRFRAQGRGIADDLRGEVLVYRGGARPERYPLVAEQVADETEGVFVARLLPPDEDFTYRARLADGRSRPGVVRVVPPPAIVAQRAWLQWPAWCGLRPNGRPYEEEQPRGNIAGLAGSTGRVAATFQKPVVRARIEFFETGEAGGAAEVRRAMGKPSREIEMELTGDHQSAEGRFPLPPAETEYQVVAEDEYGFRNPDPPRRHIRILPEEPPTVALLPEHFLEPGDRGPIEEFQVTGMPLLLGGKVRAAYHCASRWGLGRAQFRYRLNDGPWQLLPLSEYRYPPAGEFDPKTGAFSKSRTRDQVEFYAVPSANADLAPGRTLGGGRFDFQTRRISDLKVGDRLEYFVEVFGANPNPDRPPSRSETRTKTVVTEEELMTWVLEALPPGPRLSGLEGKQRTVFGQREPAATLDPVPRPTNPPPEARPPKTVPPKPEVAVARPPEAKRVAPPKPPPPKPKSKPRPPEIAVAQGPEAKVPTPPPPAPKSAPPKPTPPPPVPPPPVPAKEKEKGPATLPGMFLRSWQLLGPLPNADRRGHTAVYQPERELVDLGKEYNGLKGKIRWREHQGDTDYVDLQRFFETGSGPAVAYAACWVYVGKSHPALLRLGSNDGIKVWINRRLVYQHAVLRAAAPGQDTAMADLGEGWNEIRLKVDNYSNAWGFYLEVLDAETRRPLADLRVGLAPPGNGRGGFLREWQLLGPLTNSQQRGHDFVYPVEREAIDLAKKHDGIEGQVGWHLYRSPTNLVDLEGHFHHGAAGVAYGVCWVRSPAAKPVLLKVGSDDGIKVWLNRKLAFDYGGNRAAAPGQDAARAELKAGWNELRIKVDNRSGNWGFYLEMVDPSGGGPLADVEVRAVPPEHERAIAKEQHSWPR